MISRNRLKPDNVESLSDLVSTEYGRLDLVDPLYDIAKLIQNGAEFACDLLFEIIDAILEGKKQISLQISVILLGLISAMPIGRKVIAKAKPAQVKATPLEATTKIKPSS